jgi:hypothetical protein
MCVHVRIVRAMADARLSCSRRLQWRVASWLSLFFCLSSFTRVKTADLDMKHVFGPAM